MEAPIAVKHLFPELDEKLILLLRSLSADEWHLPTLAKAWTVKDVAAHLLDGNMRTISDHHRYAGLNAPIINSYNDLVDYLNRLNAEWVLAMKRVSPQLLTDLLEETGRKYSGIMAEAPLFTEARYSVAWAGESSSLNWFHLAREYTEKMHHQLQIRDAVGGEAALLTREFFYPFISTLMYGLPHTLRNTNAHKGSVIAVTVTGEAGGTWFVQRGAENWELLKGDPGGIQASVTIDPSVAWKLFTKGITPSQAMGQSRLDGNMVLAEKVLSMVAVMA